MTETSAPVLTPDQLYVHWQGHRRLTRLVIDAFPDDQAFTTFSIGGMRPFAELVQELLWVGPLVLHGVATGEWLDTRPETPTTRAQALRLWDAATAEMDRLWPEVAPERFQEVMKAFGQWEGPGYWQVLYGIDNEIHHRGQGFVYLRALGVEPPMFFLR